MNHLTMKLAAVVAASVALATPAGAADLELTGGVLAYSSAPTSPGAANVLTIALAAGTYAIDDPAEPITPGAAALAAGCLPLDADTVTCPAAALTSFSIETRLGIDRIVLTGIAHPAVVTAGDGNDTVIGGTAADTIVWNLGDDNDTVDGGPGDDVVVFNGGNVGEKFVIVREGVGFQLQRDIAAVTMHAQAETLRLSTAGGADTVTTQPLAATRQELVDTGADGATDTLILDAAGECSFLRGDELRVVGFQPVQFSGVETIGGINVVCGALLELAAGTLTYVASPPIVNALVVTHDDGLTVLHDANESTLSPSPEAFAAGCARIDATTVACPVAAVTTLDLQMSHGDDTVVLTGVGTPANVRGGGGADTIVGGDGDDTFTWFPGDGNDTIDGGPGTDTLDLLGNANNEVFAIAAAGTGFTLARNIGAVTIQADDTEILALDTQGGQDTVTTTVLTSTRQELTARADGLPDTLTIDARGLCVEEEADQVTAPEREPVVFASFANVSSTNVFCVFDPCVGATASAGCTVNGARNQPCQGTDGNDVIVGTAGPDVILGGDGRDRLKGGDGPDVVCGDAGDDVLLGGDGDDFVVGGPGADRLRGDAGDDDLLGGDGEDRLDGGKGNDVLHGGLGADIVRGAADADFLRGDDGLDAIDGGRGDDICVDTDQVGPFQRCEL